MKGNFYDVRKVTGDEVCSEPLGFTENNLFVYDSYMGAHDHHYIEVDNPSVSYAGNPLAEREFNIPNTSIGGDISISICDSYRQTDILKDALWIVDGAGGSKYYNLFTNEFLDYLPEDLGDFHRVKNGRLNPEHNAIAILVQSSSPSEGYNIYILSIDENGNSVDNSLERVPFDLIRNTNRDDYVLLDWR